MNRVLIYYDTIRFIERYDVTNDKKELLKKDEFHDILKTKLPSHLHDIAYKLIYYIGMIQLKKFAACMI